jgi:dihydrofolate reductase
VRRTPYIIYPVCAGLGQVQKIHCGAGDLATTLFKENLIDEVILKINPILFGSGLPLFYTIGRTIFLDLIENKTYCNGQILLKYEVKT